MFCYRVLLSPFTVPISISFSSIKVVMFLPMSVCWLVYQHDYTKCTEQIYTKFGWRIGLC